MGLFDGLDDGDELGDLLGLFDGLIEGDRVGLCVGDATTSAVSIDTSMSNEVTATVLNSSLLTTVLMLSDTPVSSEDISYSTVSSYPSSLRFLCEPDKSRAAII